jgi:peptidoglycan/LPS O-acetylase OafA/YrhL
MNSNSIARTDRRGIDLSPAKAADQHRFHFLDALRGIAAIFVAALHAPRAFAHDFIAPDA